MGAGVEDIALALALDRGRELNMWIELQFLSNVRILGSGLVDHSL